ncbi:MAG: helix-turn-helix domain-containing protein [Scytonema sp. PMC 1069.18]|jgi:putative transposase|nr:helix-turn-helix domain-containing protein [Scytonema sp. PMC 1069.18]
MPQPVADSVVLSERQKHLLTQIVRAHTNPYRLVQRAEIILLADLKMTNTEIASKLRLSRGRVRLWRRRWLDVSQLLWELESENVSDDVLIQKILLVFADEQRCGNPGKFSLEEIMQIVALACELPQTSARPVSHWTPRELALEAIKREIVPDISPRSVGRFLKSSNVTATSKPVLVKRKT